MHYQKSIHLLARIASLPAATQKGPPFIYIRSKTSWAPKLAGVPATSLMMAAFRAVETELPETERCINDPFARLLASEAGFSLMRKRQDAFAADAEAIGSGPNKAPGTAAQRNFAAARSAAFDRAIQVTLEISPSIKQIVSLGSGMDTRAFRLNLPSSVTMYEVDYPHVLSYKTQTLVRAGAKPTCKRVEVATDVAAEDWAEKLLDVGFDNATPAAWIAEGLLYYIPKPKLLELLARIHTLSQAQSRFVFDTWDNYQDIFARMPTVRNFHSKIGMICQNVTSDTIRPLQAHGWEEEESQSLLHIRKNIWRKP
jgi:methyltransferase (TIGR00027 family)